MNARYEIPTEPASWVPSYSASLHLTDDQVTRFSHIVQPAILDLAMSKRYIETARQCLAIMSSISPAVFLPPLMTKFTTSLDTLTSPHKFTAAAKCLGSVARIMVRPGHSGGRDTTGHSGGPDTPGQQYPAGPVHVTEILMSVLPGKTTKHL